MAYINCIIQQNKQYLNTSERFNLHWLKKEMYELAEWNFPASVNF